MKSAISQKLENNKVSLIKTVHQRETLKSWYDLWGSYTVFSSGNEFQNTICIFRKATKGYSSQC